MKKVFSSGLLILGGSGTDTLPEFWSPYDATIHANLPDALNPPDTFTMDAVGNTIIACHGSTCEKLSAEGSWVPHSNTQQPRWKHTSAVHEGRILLVGGSAFPTTTEWVNMDGTTEEGPFPLQDPGRQNHCSITLEDPPSMILTGGKNTGVQVTQYSLPNGDTWQLPDLTEPREYHACGVYQTSDGTGSQVG